MKYFLMFGLIFSGVYCQAQTEDTIKEFNVELVARLNEIFDKDYKVAKIKRKKTFIKFDKNIIHTSTWSTLKPKYQKQFINTLQLDKILSEKEIEEYYNLEAFIHSIHVGFHAYVENFKTKEKKRIGKNINKSEKFCVDLLFSFWKEKEGFAEDIETYKSYVKRIYDAEHIQIELDKINWKRLKGDVNPLVALKFYYEGLFNSESNSFDSVAEDFKRRYRL